MQVRNTTTRRSGENEEVVANKLASPAAALAKPTTPVVLGQVTTPPVAPPAALFVAGLLGGVASTLVGHPFDTIKVGSAHHPIPPITPHGPLVVSSPFPNQVRLQTQSIGPGIYPRYRGPVHCLKSMITEEGARSLFRGAGLLPPPPPFQPEDESLKDKISFIASVVFGAQVSVFLSRRGR